MVQTSKRKRSEKEYIRSVLANANATPNPLELLPSYEKLIRIPLSNNERSSKCCITASNSPNTTTAIVQHFASPLPSNILQQCLDIFAVNMSNMYQNSSWGLDVQHKINELKHPDAKFLIILSSSSSSPSSSADDGPAGKKCDDTATKSNIQQYHDNDDDLAVITENDRKTNNNEFATVIGFVHFRYELDNDNSNADADINNYPITYLYEIQIHPKEQKIGIGNTLLTILELLSKKVSMKKIILTVFKSNTLAMNFYIKRNYRIDDSSPSNFTTQSSSSLLSSSSSLDNNNEQCADYEILSKML